MIKPNLCPMGRTSFHGDRIKTTLAKLIELFPDAYKKGDEESSKHSFSLRIAKTQFTIYDWKLPRFKHNEEVEFNIGGADKKATEKAKRYLVRYDGIKST